MNNIGLAIKKRRLELGLTQEELAKRCGYHNKSTITKIEKGINDLNQTKIIKIAAALEVDPSDLYGYKPVEKAETKTLDLADLIKFVNNDANILVYNGKELTSEQKSIAKAALSAFKSIMDLR